MNTNERNEMRKRPLNKKFTSAVLEGRKFTTIRGKAWPVGEPIMLYNWADAPYRSKHRDVAVIRVLGFWSIEIARSKCGEMMRYLHGMENEKSLWQTEGFDSAEAMDEWFAGLVKPGETIRKTLMRFVLVERANEEAA